MNSNLARYEGTVERHQRAQKALQLAIDNRYSEEVLSVLSAVELDSRPPLLERIDIPGYEESPCLHVQDPWEWSGARCLYCNATFCY